MKKFLKGSFIVSGALILMGVMILIMCSAIGGPGVIRKAIENNELSLNISRHGKGINYFKYGFDWDFEDHQHPFYEGKQKNLNIGDGRGIENVRLEVYAASLEIKESSDYQVRLDCDVENKISCYIDSDTLILKGEEGSGDYYDKISLYLPKDINTYDVELKLGAGKVDIDKITTQDLRAEVGAGSLSIKNADINDITLRCGVGKINFKGNIRGDINMDCGVGNIAMLVEGKKNDWNYTVDSAAGEVVIGGDEYDNFANSINLDNEAEKDCEIACAIGRVGISFNETE